MEKQYSLVNKDRKSVLLKEWSRDKGLNGAHLKLLACFFMLIDHISQSAMLYEPWGVGFGGLFNFWLEPRGQMIASIMVLLGRIAFPIYCFFLVQGMFLTKDYRKYIGRLLTFGLVSELPFDFALFHGFTWQHQNVFFTLALGALMVLFLEKIRQHPKNTVLGLAMNFFVILGFVFLAEFLRTDYGSAGIIAILAFYIFHFSRIKTVLMGLIGFSFEAVLYGTVYLSLILIYFYNGKKGRMNKYFFYLFYPVHLGLIYLMRDHIIPIILAL